MKILYMIVACVSFTASQAQSQKQSLATSKWVSVDSKGKLQYATTSRGDRIMDFSQSGYKGGGVAIPEIHAKIRLSPVAGDNTDAIQRAIDSVSALPLTDGFRGAIELSKGVFPCDRSLFISASGVVLRGSGSDATGTIIQMNGQAHLGIAVKGRPVSKTTGVSTMLSPVYVPSGVNHFAVASTKGFAVGDVIRITRVVTPEWVAFMGMDQLVRNGQSQTWVNGEFAVDRVINKIEDNLLYVDVPLTDAYDPQYTGSYGVRIDKINTYGTISQVGLEHLSIQSPDQLVSIDQPHHRAIGFSGVTDAWARDIQVYNTVNSISVGGSRITLDHIHIEHSKGTLGAAKPADLAANGSQLLFNQCSIRGDNVFFLATGAKVSGPIVLLNCSFNGNGWIQPHQRWATGLLIDHCEVKDGGIDFMNRGEMGSGHGWAIGWAVAWNCKAKSYLNQQPPGAANWVIGSTGERKKGAMPFDREPLLPEGVYDSHGSPVAPMSLYLAQLAERAGVAALHNIGY